MKTSLEQGRVVLKQAISIMPQHPGIYKMIDATGVAIYVGKAKNLRKRVTNYTNVDKLPYRLKRMIASTMSVEVVTTKSEVEALLLESNLIKRLQPQYNIVLKDDKSFPYIRITCKDEYPQITKFRGKKTKDDEFFGPFASASSVNQAINSLYRAFPLRSCSDSIFFSRTRPCLQFQIKRCSGPCVGRISKSDYNALVGEARDFLSGRSQNIHQHLTEKMNKASADLEFETAAVYRDRIKALSHIQAKQSINLGSFNDLDVIAVHQAAGQSCVQIFFFRGGQNYGNRAYFPVHQKEVGSEEVLFAFIGQFYNDRKPPPLILINQNFDDRNLVEQALWHKAKRRVSLHCPNRGDKATVVADAERNAREALARRLSENSTQRKLLLSLGEKLRLEAPPDRIEVYDNSHTSGTNAVGAMIAAGPDGFLKTSYRKFTIKSDHISLSEGGIVGGDDYGMMREVIFRRFSRLIKEDPEYNRGLWPSLILIDGGIGQVGAVIQVFTELGISDVSVVGIAKGVDRKAGSEKIFLSNNELITLDRRDPVLYFLQRLRDEAHRFAIGSHRSLRNRKTLRSKLDTVQGIGPFRKKALLQQFGSVRSVSQAGVADIAKVSGISKKLAQTVYDHFHSE